jgi:hypothetical protein
MSDTYPILPSLDPHHARIGYLGALATVSVRDLDTTEALKARFHDLLFERLYPEDSRFENLKSRLGSERWAEFSKKIVRLPEEDPSAILSAVPEGDQWRYLSEFWLYDERMPSALGQLAPQQLDRTIHLAHWTGVLLPTGELSELGFVLQYLLNELRQGDSVRDFNLLLVQSRPALPLLYLRLMLNSEMLFPFLVNELVDRQTDGLPVATYGKNGLLRGAVKRMLGTIGEPEAPDDMLAARDVSDFESSVLGKSSTEENYLRPRLEILVDLGLIGRKKVAGKPGSYFMWETTDTTQRIASEWQELLLLPNRIPDYLERRFFGSMSRVTKRPFRNTHTLEEKVLWFARAFQKIGREFGFTPGRTCSLLACLMAWEAGIVLEIGDVFDAVYEAGRGQWSKYLHFSGGSRFDREFLIRVDPEALSQLERPS